MITEPSIRTANWRPIGNNRDEGQQHRLDCNEFNQLLWSDPKPEYFFGGGSTIIALDNKSDDSVKMKRISNLYLAIIIKLFKIRGSW